MKIYYNSKLAKLLTFMQGFSTMMFFGVVITEKDALSEKSKKHEGTHVRQYLDCVGLGFALSIVTMFVLFTFDVRSWWMLLLLLVPVFLYHVIYLIEFLYWRVKGYNRDEAYKRIGFERQAYWIAETWDKPCHLQHHYETFGWWKKLE